MTDGKNKKLDTLFPAENAPTAELSAADLELEEKEAEPDNADGKNEQAPLEISPAGRPRPAAPRRIIKPVPVLHDEVTRRVEKILEDGVGDAYRRLSPVAQQEFKLRGEETARAIRVLLKNTHIKVKNIFRLILEWLKMLPGINRFFLEQEAKIKTDKILALQKKS